MFCFLLLLVCTCGFFGRLSVGTWDGRCDELLGMAFGYGSVR